jgi:hypothetical protein
LADPLRKLTRYRFGGVKRQIKVFESPNRVALRGAVGQMGFSVFFFGDFLFDASKRKLCARAGAPTPLNHTEDKPRGKNKQQRQKSTNKNQQHQ